VPYAFYRHGRAVLVRFQHQLAVRDACEMLEKLRQAQAEASGPLVVIWGFDITFRAVAQVSAKALGGVLRPILSWTEQLLIAIETTEAVRSALRALFLDPALIGSAPRLPRLAKNLEEALASARKVAPQDVIRIQQLLLRGKP
jgi:hypothetical protein